MGFRETRGRGWRGGRLGRVSLPDPGEEAPERVLHRECFIQQDAPRRIGVRSRGAARGVALVALGEFGAHAGGIRAGPLGRASARALVQRGFDEDLEACLGKDDGSGVAAVGDEAARSGVAREGAHALVERRAHAAVVGHAPDLPVHGGGAQSRAGVEAVHAHGAVGLAGEADPKEHAEDILLASWVRAVAQNRPGESAVPGARVEEGPAETAGQVARESAFAGAAPTVQSDDCEGRTSAFAGHEGGQLCRPQAIPSRTAARSQAGVSGSQAGRTRARRPSWSRRRRSSCR